LVVMVARLTVGKPKYAEAEPEAWQVIETGEALRARLTSAVTLDAEAFEGILQARKLPKESDEQRNERTAAMRKATLHAASVPLEVAKGALEVLKLAVRMASIGNLNAISDAGAGANLAFAAFKAAVLNVQINLLGIETEAEPSAMLTELADLAKQADELIPALAVVLKERSGLAA
ncbi:MAG: cyclodeaminase/cyclohydrolase family protein, partial [Anaerolineaceae bacterium]